MVISVTAVATATAQAAFVGAVSSLGQLAANTILNKTDDIIAYYTGTAPDKKKEEENTSKYAVESSPSHFYVHHIIYHAPQAYTNPVGLSEQSHKMNLEKTQINDDKEGDERSESVSFEEKTQTIQGAKLKTQTVPQKFSHPSTSMKSSEKTTSESISGTNDIIKEGILALVKQNPKMLRKNIIFDISQTYNIGNDLAEQCLVELEKNGKVKIAGTSTENLQITSTSQFSKSDHMSTPEYPSMITYEARRKTRPDTLKDTVNKLTTAGFFHTGTADETVCFSCGVCLKDWMSSDDPWTAHCVYSPQCVYVSMVGSHNCESNNSEDTDPAQTIDHSAEVIKLDSLLDFIDSCKASNTLPTFKEELQKESEKLHPLYCDMFMSILSNELLKSSSEVENLPSVSASPLVIGPSSNSILNIMKQNKTELNASLSTAEYREKVAEEAKVKSQVLFESQSKELLLALKNRQTNLATVGAEESSKPSHSSSKKPKLEEPKKKRKVTLCEVKDGKPICLKCGKTIIKKTQEASTAQTIGNFVNSLLKYL